jgi:hypothetical protein
MPAAKLRMNSRIRRGSPRRPGTAENSQFVGQRTSRQAVRTTRADHL